VAHQYINRPDSLFISPSEAQRRVHKIFRDRRSSGATDQQLLLSSLSLSFSLSPGRGVSGKSLEGLESPPTPDPPPRVSPGECRGVGGGGVNHRVMRRSLNVRTRWRSMWWSAEEKVEEALVEEDHEEEDLEGVMVGKTSSTEVEPVLLFYRLVMNQRERHTARQTLLLKASSPGRFLCVCLLCALILHLPHSSREQTNWHDGEGEEEEEEEKDVSERERGRLMISGALVLSAGRAAENSSEHL